MRAFVITGPGQGELCDVAAPVAGQGEVVVEVERAGVCGTDVELFNGTMAYIGSGETSYPMRIGHEWCGVVREVGPGVDSSWIGRRVVGDTILGCDRCERCRSGHQNLCADRFEIGLRRNWPGALAERLPVPERFLHPLPDEVDGALGALVEPGGNSLQAVRAADVDAGDRLLVIGPGTIGLLAAMFASAMGVEVHLLGVADASTEFARTFGFAGVWTDADLPALSDLSFDAIVDASFGPAVPALAVELVEPGKRVVLIGLAGSPSIVDTRTITLRELTVKGLLGAGDAIPGTIELFASGRVDARRLVAATLPLELVADVLAGNRPPGTGPGPKVHFDPYAPSPSTRPSAAWASDARPRRHELG
jgi:threonine dehydrogenase-like Zn-dependent dehydrogenase